MISREEFLTILKKHHNKYFTAKQAVDAYILENYDIDYMELKFKHERVQPLIAETKKTIFMMIRDLEKLGIIEKYSKLTWMMVN